MQTGKGHADLSEDYSSIPNEMKKVAEYFGKEVLAEVDEGEVISHLEEIRKFAGDRSVMRRSISMRKTKRWMVRLPHCGKEGLQIFWT